MIEFLNSCRHEPATIRTTPYGGCSSIRPGSDSPAGSTQGATTNPLGCYRRAILLASCSCISACRRRSATRSRLRSRSATWPHKVNKKSASVAFAHGCRCKPVTSSEGLYARETANVAGDGTFADFSRSPLIRVRSMVQIHLGPQTKVPAQRAYPATCFAGFLGQQSQHRGEPPRPMTFVMAGNRAHLRE